MLVPMRNLLDKATIGLWCGGTKCYQRMHRPRMYRGGRGTACTADLGCRLCISPGFGFSGAYAGRNSCSIIRPMPPPDHGATYEQVMWALRAGFTSVMIDRSTASFEVNVRDTAEIVKAAHAVQVSVRRTGAWRRLFLWT